MSPKKVTFGATPAPKTEAPANAEQWIDSRTTEETKRLTLEIPKSLHARIKAYCAIQGVSMKDDIIEGLYQRYPDKPNT